MCLVLLFEKSAQTKYKFSVCEHKSTQIKNNSSGFIPIVSHYETLNFGSSKGKKPTKTTKPKNR